MPEAVVSALGYDGQVNLFPGSTPSLGEVHAQNGSYAIRTLDTFRHRTPVSATVSGVKALATITYEGHPYSLYMHPLDNKTDAGFGAKNQYLGHSGPGAVRDFVFRIHGVRPGSEEYFGQEVSSSDSVLLRTAFYGGSVWLDISEGDGHHYGSDLGSTFVPGSSIEMTLTPTGPLLDGSAARVLHRTIALQKPHFSYYLYDIPLGAYTATAQLIGPDGSGASPLLLQLGLIGPTTKSASVPVNWTPLRYDTSNQTLGRPMIKLFKP